MNQVNFKTLKFGVEVETVFDRERAAYTLSQLWGTETEWVGGTYSTWVVKDPKGRKWKAMSDGSVRADWQRPGESCEVVTPLLGWDDLDLFRKAIDALKAAGAYANGTCGVHVHIDGRGLTPKTLRNLVNLVNSKEDMLTLALGITDDRRANWCLPTHQGFLRKLNAQKPGSMEEFERLWYGTQSGGNRHIHYDPSRYHLLNLHSLWQGKGVEFRAFNGTLDADDLIASVTLSAATVAAAESVEHASPTRTLTDNTSYTFRCWLLRLGLIGKEYSETRKILLQRLPGNAAWKNAPATKRAQHTER